MKWLSQEIYLRITGEVRRLVNQLRARREGSKRSKQRSQDSRTFASTTYGFRISLFPGYFCKSSFLCQNSRENETWTIWMSVYGKKSLFIKKDGELESCLIFMGVYEGKLTCKQKCRENVKNCHCYDLCKTPLNCYGLFLERKVRRKVKGKIEGIAIAGGFEAKSWYTVEVTKRLNQRGKSEPSSWKFLACEVKEKGEALAQALKP